MIFFKIDSLFLEKNIAKFDNLSNFTKNLAVNVDEDFFCI